MKKLFLLILLFTSIIKAQVGVATVTWDSATAISGAVKIGNSEKPIIFTLPYQVGETTSYTFLASHQIDGTYLSLYEMDGTEVAVTIDTSKAQAIALKPVIFAGVSFIKIRRGTSASPFTSGDNLTGKIWRRVY